MDKHITPEERLQRIARLLVKAMYISEGAMADDRPDAAAD